MSTRDEESAEALSLKPLPKETRRGESELTTSTTVLYTSEDEGDEESVLPQHVNLHDDNDEEAHNEELHVEQAKRRRHRNQRILVGVCLAAIIIFVIIDSSTTKYIKTAIDHLMKWVEGNPAAGIIAFTLIIFVATVAFIPGAILTIGAGYVFERAWGLGPGVLVGSITVFVGASTGAIVSFLIGRYLLRGCVDRLAHRYSFFEALDAVMKTKGFRIMALLRLSPIIPFNAINYISGITSISLLSYSLANIAIIPGTVLFVFVGASTACIANNMGNGTTVTIVAFVIGAVFALIAIFLTSLYARRELNKIIASRQEGEVDDEGEDAFEVEEPRGDA